MNFAMRTVYSRRTSRPLEKIGVGTKVANNRLVIFKQDVGTV